LASDYITDISSLFSIVGSNLRVSTSFSSDVGTYNLILRGTLNSIVEEVAF
jgi:hypothetical protein